MIKSHYQLLAINQEQQDDQEINTRVKGYLNELTRRHGIDLDGIIPQIVNLLRTDAHFFNKVNSSVKYLFIDEVHIPDEESDTLLKEDDSKKLITAAHELINNEINEDNYTELLINQIKEKTSLKGKKLFHPVRALLTGRLKGPDMDIVMNLIGFDKCKKRIEYCYKTYCGN